MGKDGEHPHSMLESNIRVRGRETSPAQTWVRHTQEAERDRVSLSSVGVLVRWVGWANWLVSRFPIKYYILYEIAEVIHTGKELYGTVGTEQAVFIYQWTYKTTT